jgi:membrane protease YdiL (CAAX protease family)
MMVTQILVYISLFLLALSNYKLAQFLQSYFPNNLPYEYSLAIPWIAISLGLCLISPRGFGLLIDLAQIKRNRRRLLISSALVLLGLSLFIGFGITKYFHSVKYPFVFFLIIPLVEELIFRGFIYGTLEKFGKYSPIIVSSILFGLHHLQYSNFSITTFIVFQILYTLSLGLLFGKIRKLSGSIYVSLLLHILINFVVLKF